MARRSNTEGSIFKRSYGSWRAQVTIGGQRMSFTSKTQRECREWLRTTISEFKDGFDPRMGKIKLEDFIEGWISSIQSTHRSNSVELYESVIRRQVLPILGERMLIELKPQHIQALYNQKIKDGYSAHAVNQIHKILHVVFEHAKKLRLIARNPSSGTTPPVPITTEMNFFDENQVQTLLLTAKSILDRYFPLYYVAIHSGMRQAELLGLKWTDLDLQKKTLKIQRQAIRPKGGGYEFRLPKTKAGKRTIILGSSALEVLREHQEVQFQMIKQKGDRWQKLDLIFPSSIGTPVVASNLRTAFRRLLANTNLPKIRFHDLRHTAASIMLNYGIPVIIVSRRLGHAKPSITMDVYGHLISSKQKEAAQLMDEILTPVSLPVAPDLHRD